MPSQFDRLYKVYRKTVLSDDVLNVITRDVDLRLTSLEALKISWQEALAVVQDRVLAASEAVIASLRDELVGITQLNFLVAGSDTPLTLAPGATLALVILADDRALFAPGPFSILSNATDPDSYAVIRTVSYSRDIGQYDFQVVSVTGSAATNADWQVAAVAGSTLAQIAYLEQGQAAAAQVRSDAAAAGDAATGAAAAAAQARRFASGLAFTAASATAAVPALGPLTLTLTPATAQGFAPSAFLAVLSAGDPHTILIGQFASFDAGSAALTLLVTEYTGTAARADWTIAPTPPPYVPSGIDGGYAGDPAPPGGATTYASATPATFTGIDGGYA